MVEKAEVIFVQVADDFTHAVSHDDSHQDQVALRAYREGRMILLRSHLGGLGALAWRCEQVLNAGPVAYLAKSRHADGHSRPE